MRTTDPFSGAHLPAAARPLLLLRFREGWMIEDGTEAAKARLPSSRAFEACGESRHRVLVLSVYGLARVGASGAKRTEVKRCERSV